jgi:hypothetical protein
VRKRTSDFKMVARAKSQNYVNRILCCIALVSVLVLLTSWGVYGRAANPLPARLDSPTPLARWPWPQAAMDHPHPGVTHWIDRSSTNGTVVELFDFDFRRNPGLRLELYDQDEDDRVPYDDRAEFWPKGVGQVTRYLNQNGRGKVVAAWNGLFFQYTGVGRRRIGSHVAPVVLNGRVRYNVGLVRWAVGVKYGPRGPVFKVLRQPAIRTLGREFDFAAEGASCLINRGRPLRLVPFPKPGQEPPPATMTCKPGEAGYVRIVDHMHTSRTSMAWSKDNRHFYLLIVKDPGSETASAQALSRGTPHTNGWTVADLQRFWHRFGAWCAVNIDGGDVTQLVALRSDGRYDLVPPHWADHAVRHTLPTGLAGAPGGGSMMYFYIRDTGKRK